MQRQRLVATGDDDNGKPLQRVINASLATTTEVFQFVLASTTIAILQYIYTGIQVASVLEV